LAPLPSELYPHFTRLAFDSKRQMSEFIISKTGSEVSKFGNIVLETYRGLYVTLACLCAINIVSITSHILPLTRLVRPLLNISSKCLNFLSGLWRYCLCPHTLILCDSMTFMFLQISRFITTTQYIWTGQPHYFISVNYCLLHLLVADYDRKSN